jgi:hypothetical protein
LESKPRPNGIVFVSYARVDLGRVKPLVDELAKRFNIFMDLSSLVPGSYWRHGIVEGLQRARCVLGLYTKGLSDESVALDEMDRVKKRKILLPVKLDRDAEIPIGHDGIQRVDLCDWRGGAKGLSALFAAIEPFLAAGPSQEEGQMYGLRSLQSQIDDSSYNVAQLRTLADRVATIGGVLAGNSAAVEAVKGSLKEIHATCSATLAAIDRFLEPMKQGQSLHASYLTIPGELRQIVRDSAGHCTRILEYYERVGGLHDWLLEHATPDLVEQAERVFLRLATADGDIFDAITSIAAALDGEATRIRELLIRREETEAQNRLRDAQLKLLQLRQTLEEFIEEFSNAKSKLGYVRGL